MTTHSTYPQVATHKLDIGWIHVFIGAQFILQILLLFPQFGVLRAPMRMGTFGLSIIMLLVLQRKGVQHPVTGWVLLVLSIMGLQFGLHNTHNSTEAAIAQCGVYLAILAPVFWVSRLHISPKAFSTLIFLLWAFHSVSAFFGLLQVYFPGQYQPFLSTAIQEGAYGGDHLLVTLASGEQVFRPMGLTDRPGGAASAGFYAFLLSAGLALKYPSLTLRILCLISGSVGLFVIYLSQLRSTLILAAICLLALGFVLARKAQFARLSVLLLAGTAIFLSVYSWAVVVGGEATLSRVGTLFEEAPTDVYYKGRGLFLDHTLKQIPDYPFGAGLGRWGTTNAYFGRKFDPVAPSLWVEIQWTGWLYDGGVALMVVYGIVLSATAHLAWRIALDPRLAEVSYWGALIFAYDVGAIALTFSYPLFNSQGGMEFWVLNGALFVAFNMAKRQWLFSRAQAQRLELTGT